MTTLTDFLLARIAEDEAVARAAVGEAIGQRQTGRLVYEQVPHRPTGTTIPIIFARADGGGKTQVANMETAWERDERANHIARHDPARVLAECEAKRRIVELHACEGKAPGMPSRAHCVTCVEHDAEDYPTVLNWPCPTIRALALPYADHADYRAEWRP